MQCPPRLLVHISKRCLDYVECNAMKSSISSARCHHLCSRKRLRLALALANASAACMALCVRPMFALFVSAAVL